MLLYSSNHPIFFSVSKKSCLGIFNPIKSIYSKCPNEKYISEHGFSCYLFNVNREPVFWNVENIVVLNDELSEFSTLQSNMKTLYISINEESF